MINKIYKLKILLNYLFESFINIIIFLQLILFLKLKIKILYKRNKIKK